MSTRKRTFSSATSSDEDDDDSSEVALSSEEEAPVAASSSSAEPQDTERKRLARALNADPYSVRACDTAYVEFSSSLAPTKILQNEVLVEACAPHQRAAVLVNRLHELGCDAVFSASTNTQRPRNVTFATRRFRRASPRSPCSGAALRIHSPAAPAV